MFVAPAYSSKVHSKRPMIPRSLARVYIKYSVGLTFSNVPSIYVPSRLLSTTPVGKRIGKSIDSFLPRLLLPLSTSPAFSYASGSEDFGPEMYRDDYGWQNWITVPIFNLGLTCIPAEMKKMPCRNLSRSFFLLHVCW